MVVAVWSDQEAGRRGGSVFLETLTVCGARVVSLVL